MLDEAAEDEPMPDGPALPYSSNDLFEDVRGVGNDILLAMPRLLPLLEELLDKGSAAAPPRF